MTRRRATLVVGLLCLASWMTLAGCGGAATAFVPDGGRFVGEAAGLSVYVVESETDRHVEVVTDSGRGEEPFWDAAILRDGTIFLAGAEKGLVRRSPGGVDTQILQPYDLAGTVFLDPSERWLAYPCVLQRDSDGWITHVGIGLLDVQTNSAKVVLAKDGTNAELLGWHGEKMVFFLSSDSHTLRTLDLAGREDTLFQTPKTWRYCYPIVRSRLACIVPDGVAMVDLGTMQQIELPGASKPTWTKRGLEVTVQGGRRLMLGTGGD